MDRIMRNDELSSTALSYRPNNVQELRPKEVKTRRHDIENEASSEGVE